MSLDDFLNSKIPPPEDDIDLSPQDIIRLFWKYKGLLKAFEREKDFWSSTNENLTFAYGQLNEQEQELAKAYNTIQEDLEVASQIQKAFLPTLFNVMSDNLDCAIYHKQLKKVGGDYYDFFKTRSNDFALALFDISGHGVSAALVMAYLKAQFLQAMKIYHSPRDIVGNVNSTSLGYLRSIKKYSSVTFVLFGNNNIRYVCGGGHGLLIHGGEMRNFRKGNNYLGLRNYPFKEHVFPFSKGDLLVLYTDGIVEAQNNCEEDYTIKRLNSLIMKHSEKDVKDIISICINDYKSFRTRDIDDITLIILKKKDV